MISASDLLLQPQLSINQLKSLAVLLSVNFAKTKNLEALETRLQEGFCLEFFEQAKNICDAEAKLYFSNDSAKESATNARENWSTFLKASEGIFKSFFETQTMTHENLRVIAAVVSTQFEWFEDIEFAKIPAADRKKVMLESPLISLKTLLK